jgi:hypothetical protein
MVEEEVEVEGEGFPDAIRVEGEGILRIQGAFGSYMRRDRRSIRRLISTGICRSFRRDIRTE